MGIPCAHVIDSLLNTYQPLQVEHFHKHWWLCILPSDIVLNANGSIMPVGEVLGQMEQRYELMPPHQQRLVHLQIEQLSQESHLALVQNPIPIRGRGRPQGSTA